VPRGYVIDGPKYCSNYKGTVGELWGHGGLSDKLALNGKERPGWGS
jgi:hypothetical protein